MDLRLTEEQEIMKQGARDFLAMECTKLAREEMINSREGYSRGVWKKMADLGWTGLLFPQKYGGIGGSFLDLMVLLEEIGRVGLPGPFFSTVILSGLTILKAGSEVQKQEFLPRISEGELVVTLALSEPETEYSPAEMVTRAEPVGDNYSINGTKLFVPYAHVAQHIIVVTRTQEDGITLFLLDSNRAGLNIAVIDSIARDKQCEIAFNKVQASTGDILGELRQGWKYMESVLQQAAIAKCAEMLGGAQRVLEMAVDYAKERKQFERHIGSFQAIQHYCANMLVSVETSRLITYEAATMVSQGIPCRKEAAMAKAWTSQAYRRVTALGHQILAGLGFIEDHELPLYSRQAKAAEINFGDANFHTGIIARELGL